MNKSGKFMVFTSIAAAGAAAVLYFKKKIVGDPADEDVFDDENCDCQKEEPEVAEESAEPSDSAEEASQEAASQEAASQEEAEEK